jgi:hypothetical protein
MRRLLACTVALAFVLALAAALPAAAQGGSWTGWITDENCGAKGANAAHKDCALKCRKDGGNLVFYNTGDEKIYKLSDQDAAAANLGYPVKVVGHLEGDLIHVGTITKAEGD